MFHHESISFFLCRRRHGYDGNGVLFGISHTTGAQVRWMKMAASKPSFTDDTMGYPWDIHISAGEIHPFAAPSPNFWDSETDG